MFGDKQREIDRLSERIRVLESLTGEARTALAAVQDAMPGSVSPNWREDLAAFRRAVVDHILTGLQHPDSAVRTQARSLMTELDCAGLSVDADVRAALSSAP